MFFIFTAGPAAIPPSHPRFPLRGSASGGRRRGRGRREPRLPSPPHLTPARRYGSDAGARGGCRVTFRGGGRCEAASSRFSSAHRTSSPPPRCRGAAGAARPAWRPPPGEGRWASSFLLLFFFFPAPVWAAGRKGLSAIPRLGGAPGWGLTGMGMGCVWPGCFQVG